MDLRYELVMLDNQVLPLTRKEYCLLLLLVQHAGEAVPRKTLLMQVWGHVPEMCARAVNVHVQRLRRKLGIYGDQYIETAHGVGYRFRPMSVSVS